MKRNDQCPSSEELMTRYCDGADQYLLDHLSSCEQCAGEWAKIETLVQAGRKIEIEEPAEERIDQIRRNLLSSMRVETNPGRRRFSAFAAVITLAALSLAAWVILGLLSDSAHKGKIIAAGPDASYHFTSTQPEEELLLEHGNITLEVEPLTPSEDFRVAVGDCFVVVVGTVFEVRADHGKLIDVTVFKGKVEVIRPNEPKVTLLAGNRLSTVKPKASQAVIKSEVADKPDDVASAKQQPIQEEAKKAKIIGKKTKQKIKPKPMKAQKAFSNQKESIVKSQLEEGLSLVKSGRYLQAAEVFAQAQKSEGNRALIEEAAYWQGLALQRAGRVSQAEKAFVSFLARFPASPRRGEVAVALGWILFNRGDYQAALSYFQMAASDSSQKVRSSAGRGLDAIDGKR